jgi:hypothetical protein
VTLNNVSPQTVTFTPMGGYTGPAGFTYKITNGHGGTASAQVSLTVNPPGATTSSLFNASDTPATVTVNDPNPVELGVKFQSSQAGTITGIRDTTENFASTGRFQPNVFAERLQRSI